MVLYFMPFCDSWFVAGISDIEAMNEVNATFVRFPVPFGGHDPKTRGCHCRRFCSGNLGAAWSWRGCPTLNVASWPL